MDKKTSNNAAAIGIVLVVLVAAVGYGYYWQKHHAPQAGQKAEESKRVPLPGVVNLPVSEMPPALPADLPLESGATALQSYYGVNNNTEASTYQYVSNLSVADSLASYQKYFTANKWKITQPPAEAPSQSDFAFLAASKGNQNLLVNISKNSITGAVVVNVTLTQPAPASATTTPAIQGK